MVWCGAVQCGVVRCGAVWCGAVRCGAVQRGRVGQGGAGKDRKRERERGTARTACVVAAAIAGVEAAADTGSAAGVEAACPDRGTSSAETRRAALCGGVGTELCFESHAAHAGRGGVLWSCAVWRGAVRWGVVRAERSGEGRSGGKR